MPSRPLLISSSHRPLRRILSSSSRDLERKSLFIPVIVGAVAALVVAILVFFFVFFYYWRRRKQSKRGNPEARGNPHTILRYKYRQLKRATKGFSQSRKLGKGGFGVVYRGFLSDGKEVAVKKLDHLSLQGEREFLNELFICSGLDSPYVVSLLGYCTYGKRLRLLVYECMPRRSLQEALFEKGYPEPLDWKKRFKIILDTAKALEFLHVRCNPPIIHGDVKPSNVLLDQDFSARIADFGLARFKTENFGLESARHSSVSEQVKQPETPEYTVFGPPEVVSPVTPELSRSSTTHNPFSDCSSRVVDCEFSKELQSFSKESPAALDTILSGRIYDANSPAGNREVLTCTPGPNDDLEDLACALHSNHGIMHSGQSPDIAKRSEMPISSALQNNSKQKADESAVPDIQVHDHTSEVSFSVVSDRMAAKGNSFEEVASPNTSQLSPLKTGRTEREWKTGCGNKPVAGKEYVLDWLDSELHVDGQGSPEVMRDENLGLKTGNGKSRLGMVEVQTEETVKDKKRTRDPSRKGREWWKDEYFAELGGKAESDAVTVKKSGKHRNFESWKDYLSAEFTGFSGDLRADARSTRFSGRSCSKEWMRSSRSGDLSFYGPIERQRVPSIVSDMCSEDRRLQFSSELVNGQWSGELTKSGELVIKDASSTTSMRGTVCYVAPENGGNGILSEKSDIYSFGVLMLVILSGRRPIQVTATPMKEFERANLISWARNLSQNGKLLDLMDEKLSGDFDREEALLCITLALLCLQRVPSTRPHISEIVKILCRQMAVPNLPLELSPSPPARTPYKVSSFSPKEHSVQSRPITSSTDSTSVMTSSML